MAKRQPLSVHFPDRTPYLEPMSATYGGQMKYRKSRTVPDTKTAWKESFDETTQHGLFNRIDTGDLVQEDYASFLRQSFHIARAYGAALARFPTRFRGHQRTLGNQLVKHSLAQQNLQLMVLNDIKALGLRNDCIPFERPLPSTHALCALMNHTIDYENPLSFLGCIFHMEHAPQAIAKALREPLQNIGAGEDTMTFLKENRVSTLLESKTLEDLFEEMIRTDEDFESVVSAQGPRPNSLDLF